MRTESSRPASGAGQDWLPLGLILLLGLVVRLGLFAGVWYCCPSLSTTHGDDTLSYLGPARSLIESGQYNGPDGPELLRTPGYPLLLTAGIAAGHVEVVTVALQILLGLISVAVIYRLTRALTGSRGAAIGAALLLAP